MDALFGHRIMLIDKYSKLYLKNAFRPLGLSTAEAMTILYLWQSDTEGEHTGEHVSEALTQDRLAAVLHYDKGFMTRTIKALEDKHLVARRTNPDDARSYLFNLEPAAKGLPPTIMDILDTWTNTLFEGIDDAQLKELDAGLSTMLRNVMTSSDEAREA